MDATEEVSVRPRLARERLVATDADGCESVDDDDEDIDDSDNENEADDERLSSSSLSESLILA